MTGASSANGSTTLRLRWERRTGLTGVATPPSPPANMASRWSADADSRCVAVVVDVVALVVVVVVVVAAAAASPRPATIFFRPSKTRLKELLRRWRFFKAAALVSPRLSRRLRSTPVQLNGNKKKLGKSLENEVKTR